MAHNHPSGCADPSTAERRVTGVMREATELVGLTLLDHLIVADTGYYSFREAEDWER
jgi:DNA repair protein RadC